MFKYFKEEEVRALANAMTAGRLCGGRLMPPAVVERARSRRNLHPSVVQGWQLCGELAPEMFAMASPHKLLHLSQSFCGPGGVTYLVLAQQRGHWQHRFVVQLLGPQAKDYLAFALEKPTGLSLANGGGEKAMYLYALDVFKQLVPPSLPVLPVPVDALAVAEGAAWAGVQMLSPEALVEPSFPKVTDVCVSVVQMPDVVATRQSLGALLKGGGAAH